MTRTLSKRLLSLMIALVLLFGAACTTLMEQASTVSALTVAWTLGDVDLNGTLNTKDARLYLQALINNSLTTAQKDVADVNDDGQYSSLDVRAMLIRLLQETQPVRSIWLPYWEVASLMSSGNAATTRSAIDACLDDCAARGANTIYFHVRANSDAYYDSALFKEHTAAATLINAGFDPFEYAVQAAHARGLKIEAWVNPYRIGRDASYAATSATFVYNSNYYYVPTNAAVKQLVVDGVRELVENYDIDGVQFDDYFYPEGAVSATAAADFETADYNAYTTAGGTLSVADWRRASVNELVSSCYAVCHTKENCVFGISPAYDIDANYSEKYADLRTWAKTAGYVDYLCPQLYTGFSHVVAPFDQEIAKWDALTFDPSVQLIAGLALYKTGLLDDTWAGTNGRYEWKNNSDIMARQVALAKQLDWDGVALYSHLSFDVDTSERDAAVANTEIASVCEAWKVFA